MQQFLSSLFVGLALIVSVWMLSTLGVRLVDSSANQTIGGATTNTINVDADGKVTVSPDMMVLSVTASQIGKTNAQAQQLVNTAISQVKAVLKKANIADKDIQSTNVSVYPEYVYNGNSSQISGYRATHSLTIEIMLSGGQATTADTIIDEVTKITDIQVNGVSYDIKDKSPAYQKARELAFAKAKEKASQLAKLGGLTLDKPLSINESINQSFYPMPMMRQSNMMQMDATSSSAQESSVSPGQMDVVLTLNVVRGVK